MVPVRAFTFFITIWGISGHVLGRLLAAVSVRETP